MFGASVVVHECLLCLTSGKLCFSNTKGGSNAVDGGIVVFCCRCQSWLWAEPACFLVLHGCSDFVSIPNQRTISSASTVIKVAKDPCLYA